MYVSSYNTYINTNSSDKTQRSREVPKESESSKGFQNSFAQANDEQVLVSSASKLPVSYISNYKALSNRQQLQEQTQKQDESNQSVSIDAKTKFSKMNAMSNAQVSYTENSKQFPLISKPKVTLSEAPKEEVKQQPLRTKVVNTYIANDNYFKITAA